MTLSVPANFKAALRELGYEWDVVTTLDSEKDVNFLLTCLNGEKIVVKIFQDSTDIDLMMHAMSLAFSSGLRCPRIITKESNCVALSYIEGITLSRYGVKELLSEEIGAAVGRLTLALSKCVESRRSRLNWNFINFDSVTADSEFPAIRSLVSQRLEKLMAQRPSCQLCHYDLNDDNILLLPSGGIGFIDFGDVDTGPRVIDLALCICYILLNQADPSSYGIVINRVLSGYRSVINLSELELELCGTLVIARSLMSLSIQTSRIRTNANNSDYLGVSVTGNVKFLQYLSIGSNLEYFFSIFL